ncbi:hypothetical protein IV203_004054 [Nitzschia inconspicua]|uniref:Uncharacterized protein n=1 Tax=Nitzschia inconspicua TaxID=303405 RepID=A0A9K3L2V9_9STRA|nr:hypothetical protein IV203_004054 [Nitzschia inconspicua]
MAFIGYLSAMGRNNRRFLCKIGTAVLIALSCTTTDGFAAPCRTMRWTARQATPPFPKNFSSLNMHGIPDGGIYENLDSASSSILIAAGEWRQYVSLAVVAGVLIDILLGSPLANAALKPLRDAQGLSQEETEEEKAAKATARSKERIDSDKVAQAAIDKAQNVLELKKYLEARKTDWDRMEELKRDLDRNMQDLDEDLRARQESLDKKLKN